MKITRFAAPAVLTAIMSIAAIVGCSSRSQLPVYDPSQVGTVMTSQKGEIVAVRDVVIEPQPQTGASTGSILGGGVGRSVATGNPGSIGGAVGSVIGATVGAKSDEKLGEELAIVVEGGNRIIIVQEQSDPPFAPGEKVEIITGQPASTRHPGGVWGRGIPVGIPTGSSGGGTRVVRDQRFATSAPELSRRL